MEHRPSSSSNAHSRMAVESLLLSEDSAIPGGRKDAEWVGENAAPAFIVGPLFSRSISHERIAKD
jgi:hypothetical protein